MGVSPLLLVTSLSSDCVLPLSPFAFLVDVITNEFGVAGVVEFSQLPLEVDNTEPACNSVSALIADCSLNGAEVMHLVLEDYNLLLSF